MAGWCLRLGRAPPAELTVVGHMAAAERASQQRNQLLGGIYDSAPYGYVVAKDQVEMAKALQAAVDELIKNGTYEKILGNWGVQAGAVPSAQINP